MGSALITIDTEYSHGLYQKNPSMDWRENYARSISCETADGDVGIEYQMDIFDQYGMKAVFFVDPMPALLFGQESIDAIVHPILERGHEVQLHIHSEWLSTFSQKISDRYFGTTPFFAHHMHMLPYEMQKRVIEAGCDILVKAGAPRPTAFRAGNYGANDDSLRALADMGIKYDSSFCPAILNSACQINLPPDQWQPIYHHGVIEMPIGAISGPSGTQRHAQITAISAREIFDALNHAVYLGRHHFIIVSHSFELLSRNRKKINHIVRRRFEKACAMIADIDDLDIVTFANMPDPMVGHQIDEILPHNPARTIERVAEQIVGNILYGNG
ncbi:hypothetical protein LPB140_10760 [Sphingorhabdus lutea]|uniref:Chitooligosaccharide deacetylase n=1 Tax=Sphingorhabdus lutea TaxID=1913578 RepID=A0A1L3JDI6_9SPHN|nr:polysaccharide deacetylase family protein [Sphingorhabdus lutea]APG63190.1 hypothetical protein LPB140_10760 [Sphingorhabdus lutea]